MALSYVLCCRECAKIHMFKKVFIALAALIIGFVVIVALQPSEFRVSRSINIAAPAQAVFEQVNDFHKWDAWSPWAKRDPNMRQTYEEAPAGVGASYSWSGNNEVGEGRMTLTESRPNEMVRVKLEFLRPFAATHPPSSIFSPAAIKRQLPGACSAPTFSWRKFSVCS